MGATARGRKGFSLIEIVIVLAIIGISAAIAIPAYRNYTDGSKVKLCIRNMRLLENAIKAYQFDSMRLPDSLNDLLGTNGSTVRQSPPFRDPWGNSFRYVNLTHEPPGFPNARWDGFDRPLNLDYDLYSVGADGRTQQKLNNARSLDDVVRARSGAFLDLASKY